MDADSRDAYTAMGISEEALSTPGLIVSQDGNLDKYTTEQGYLFRIELAGGEKAEIVKQDSDLSPKIIYKEQNYNLDEEGITIFIYDNLLKEYVSSAYFSSNDEMRLNRIVLEEAVDTNW